MEKWMKALVVYITREVPGYNQMHRYISQTWNNVTEPELFLHEEGYYFVKFQSLGDFQDILYGRPYTMNSRLVILKHWTSEFDFNVEFLTEIPLWLKLPNLPINCLGMISLCKMDNALVIYIFVDQWTTKKTRVSYARILITVNVTKKLHAEVIVKDPSGISATHRVWMETREQFWIGRKCKFRETEDPNKFQGGYQKVNNSMWLISWNRSNNSKWCNG